MNDGNANAPDRRGEALKNDVLVVNGSAIEVNKFLLAQHSRFFHEQFFTLNNFEIRDQSVNVGVFRNLLAEIDRLERQRHRKFGYSDEDDRWNITADRLNSIEAIFELAAKFQFVGLQNNFLCNYGLPSVFRFRLAQTYGKGSMKCFPTIRGDLTSHSQLVTNFVEFNKLSPQQRTNFAFWYRLSSLLGFGIQVDEECANKWCIIVALILAIIVLPLIILVGLVTNALVGKTTTSSLQEDAFIIGTVCLALLCVLITCWFFCQLVKGLFALHAMLTDPRDVVRINGSRVRVDKMALAAKSPYFQRFFFDRRFVEGKLQRFEINDPTISARNFEMLCAAAIDGQMPREDQIESVLALSDRFDLPLSTEAMAEHLAQCNDKAALFKLRIALKLGVNQTNNFRMLLTQLNSKELARHFVENALEYQRMEPRHRVLLKKRLSGMFINMWEWNEELQNDEAVDGED